MLKMFLAEYKKCNEVKGSAKSLEDGSNSLKFSRHDMILALDWLEEEVMQYKVDTSDDPIKATKIEDYKDRKEVGYALKAVNHALDEWKKAGGGRAKPPDPDKSPTFGNANKKMLLNIKNDFIKYKKKLPSGVKLEPALVKLEKQIDEDLKEIEQCKSICKKISKEWYEADKLYDLRIKQILKATPRLSPKQRKFNELAPKQLTKRALTNVKTDCNKLLTEMKKKCELAKEETGKGNTQKAISHWKAATKQLQSLEKQVSVYTKILTKYKVEISRSDNKKLIKEHIKRLAELAKIAKERFDGALEEINKIAAEAKKEH